MAAAIRWLSEVVLPEAIRNDHSCHSQGIQPTDGYAGLAFVNLRRG